MRLLDYAADVYSQFGEDGILERILELLPIRDKWCVEFGAWDGQHLSNTCHLIQHGGYSAVLIEADTQRFGDLLSRFANNHNVLALNKVVGFSSSDGLDALLVGTPIPKDFDLLSIDVDGNDYHIWNAISAYAPKVVCIEYNPTIPTEVDFVQPPDLKVNQGSSLSALVRLGRQKGYELACVTGANAIFVRAIYFSLLGILDNEPRALREDISQIAQIFCGYDGTLFIAGSQESPWHGIRYRGRLRQLPKIFRVYPGNFGRSKSVVFGVYRKLCRLLERG